MRRGISGKVMMRSRGWRSLETVAFIPCNSVTSPPPLTYYSQLHNTPRTIHGESLHLWISSLMHLLSFVSSLKVIESECLKCHSLIRDFWIRFGLNQFLMIHQYHWLGLFDDIPQVDIFSLYVFHHY